MTESIIERSLDEGLSRGIREEITHSIDGETVQYVSAEKNAARQAGTRRVKAIALACCT